MIKQLIFLTIALALAGCAITPDSIKEQGTMEQYRLNKLPRPAAHCAAQKAVEFSDNIIFLTQILEYESPESLEIRVLIAGLGMLAALARIERAGDGSNMIVWLSPKLPEKLLVLGRKMADGC